jgi:hypothetical protein
MLRIRVVGRNHASRRRTPPLIYKPTSSCTTGDSRNISGPRAFVARTKKLFLNLLLVSEGLFSFFRMMCEGNRDSYPSGEATVSPAHTRTACHQAQEYTVKVTSFVCGSAVFVRKDLGRLTREVS